MRLSPNPGRSVFVSQMLTITLRRPGPRPPPRRGGTGTRGRHRRARTGSRVRPSTPAPRGPYEPHAAPRRGCRCPSRWSGGAVVDAPVVVGRLALADPEDPGLQLRPGRDGREHPEGRQAAGDAQKNLLGDVLDLRLRHPEERERRQDEDPELPESVANRAGPRRETKNEHTVFRNWSAPSLHASVRSGSDEVAASQPGGRRAHAFSLLLRRHSMSVLSRFVNSRLRTNLLTFPSLFRQTALFDTVQFTGAATGST